MQAKLLKAEFTLEDFLAQMQQIKKMGPLQGLLGMIPGMGKAAEGRRPRRRASSSASRPSSSR